MINHPIYYGEYYVRVRNLNLSLKPAAFVYFSELKATGRMAAKK